MRLGERGSAAAEFAVVLPAVALVVVLGIAALSAGTRLVRLNDAVADASRLVARGDDPGRAHAVVAGVGGSAAIEERGDLVCVSGVVPAPPLLLLPPLTATACALAGGG